MSRPIVAAILSSLLLTTCAPTSRPWRTHVIDDSLRGADGVRAADVNGDGVPDLVTSWENSGVTRIYLSATDRRGFEAVTVGRSRKPEDAVFTDLDGDGASDVVGSAEGPPGRVTAYWAPSARAGATEWRSDVLHEDASSRMYALPMDVDGRAGLDIVTGSKGPGASVGWLESPADPRDPSAWTYHHISDAGWIMSIIATDVDNDGRTDILISDREGGLAGVRWLERPRAGDEATAPWRDRYVGARGDHPHFVAVADLDGDGRNEVVVPYRHADEPRLSVFRLAGDRWRESRLRYPAIAGTVPKGAAVGDVDLDGRPDIVLSTEDAHGTRRGIVWLRSRDGPFVKDWEARDVSGPSGVKFDASLLLDVDGDGDLDVVNTEEAEGHGGLGLVWYENPSRR